MTSEYTDHRTVKGGDADGPAEKQPRQTVARKCLACVPGLVLAGAGYAVSMVLHRLVPSMGEVTFCVILGALLANLNMVPANCRPGLKLSSKRLMRVGVGLLGLTVSAESIIELGLPVTAMVLTTLVTTFLVTKAVGRRFGLSAPRSLLLGTGFAICGASAIAAMQSNADAEEEDVGITVALVTLCGTGAMLTLPLLQGPLGLNDHQMGIWIGASIHDVGQVVGAAGAVGGAALGIALVVKLARVMMLAPMVALVGMRRRRENRYEQSAAAARPPVVPLFLAAFVACVALRTTGMLPAAVLNVASVVQSAAIGMALFGMGAGVHLPTLLRRGRGEAGLALAATLFIAAFSYLGVQLIGR